MTQGQVRATFKMPYNMLYNSFGVTSQIFPVM
jgi:hypothetical protein